MKQAPSSPSTSNLLEKFPLPHETVHKIAQHRLQDSQILKGLLPGFVAYVGPCGPDILQLPVLESEAFTLQKASNRKQNLVVNQRQNFWKPRTNPESWWGLDTTNPEAMFATMARLAILYASGAAEIGQDRHFERYAHMLVFAWFGGRNKDLDFKIQVATEHPELPIGVKNDLSGDIDMLLDEVALLREKRGPEGAAIVPIYRGGTNATTPEAWEKQYIRMHELTGGLFVADMAHGAEMAHDPTGLFSKSPEGQTASDAHLLDLSRAGLAPVAKMNEAGRAASPQLDPSMPLDIALGTALDIYQLQTN